MKPTAERRAFKAMQIALRETCAHLGQLLDAQDDPRGVELPPRRESEAAIDKARAALKLADEVSHAE